MILNLAKDIITKTYLFYVTFLFLHFSSKQLIFVNKHTFGTERLVIWDSLSGFVREWLCYHAVVRNFSLEALFSVFS